MFVGSWRLRRECITTRFFVARPNTGIMQTNEEEELHRPLNNNLFLKQAASFQASLRPTGRTYVVKTEDRA